jgi:hypothetical protein
LFMFSRIR